MPLENAREKVDHVGFDFLVADLGLGLTLARIAANSGDDPAKRARNVQNARRAYDMVQRLANRAMLREAQRLELEDKAAGLKSELEKLGEVFDAFQLWRFFGVSWRLHHTQR